MTPPMLRRIREITLEAGMQVRVVHSVEETVDLPWQAFPCLLEFIPGKLTDTAESPNLAALRTIAEDFPDYRVIVVSADSTAVRIASDLYSIDRSISPVLNLSSEAPQLVPKIEKCRLLNWSMAEEHRIETSTHLLRLAQQILIWNLRMDVGITGYDPSGKSALKAVAKGIGSSERAITHIDRSRGLHLHDLWDGCRALRIHASHEIDGTSPKKLIRHGGYHSASAVTRLFQRVHGITPTEAFERGIELSVRKVEAILTRCSPGDRIDEVALTAFLLGNGSVSPDNDSGSPRKSTCPPGKPMSHEATRGCAWFLRQPEAAALPERDPSRRRRPGDERSGVFVPALGVSRTSELAPG